MMLMSVQAIHNAAQSYIDSRDDKVCWRQLVDHLSKGYTFDNFLFHKVWDIADELRPQCGYDCNKACPYSGTPTDP